MTDWSSLGEVPRILDINFERSFISQLLFTGYKSTMERAEQCVNSVQSLLYKHQNDVNDVVLVSLSLTLNRFHTFFWCFNCSICTSKYWLCVNCPGWMSVIVNSLKYILSVNLHHFILLSNCPNWPISGQCWASYRNQLFDLLCKSNGWFL